MPKIARILMQFFWSNDFIRRMKNEREIKKSEKRMEKREREREREREVQDKVRLMTLDA